MPLSTAWQPGEEKEFFPNKECAFLLIEGDVTFFWNGQTAGGKRAGCFDNGAEVCALHVPRNTRVSLRAATLSEVFVVSTENEKDFSARFYDTEAIRNVTSCADICGGTCEWKVTIVFDDMTAPYSNLVLGETYPLLEKWYGYPPHEHPRPGSTTTRWTAPRASASAAWATMSTKSRTSAFLYWPMAPCIPR